MRLRSIRRRFRPKRWPRWACPQSSLACAAATPASTWWDPTATWARSNALAYLYALGHRRIGFVWGSEASSRSRLRAFTDFHTQRGLPQDEALVVATAYSAEGGRSATRHLLALPDPPTAIFAANDQLALAAIQAASALGVRVPEALSIVGMDDIESASTSTPPLTTVAKDKIAIGQKAAALLLDRLQENASEEPRSIVVPCRLVERLSAAAARSTQPALEMRPT